jgi:hypothetical protein
MIMAEQNNRTNNISGTMMTRHYLAGAAIAVALLGTAPASPRPARR